MRAVAALGLVVALVAGGCRRGEEDGAWVANGHVEATEVRIATKIGGRLAALTVDEGDAVAAGQEIARIDPVDLEIARRSGVASRDAAAAELDLRRAGPRREEIAEARDAVQRAEAELAAARRDRDRFEALVERGSGTEKSRDDARTRVAVAQETVEGLRQRLRRLEAGSRAEEIRAAEARLALAEASVAGLDQQLADAVVRAPSAGIVTARLAEPGELLAPGTPLLTVVDLARPWLTVYVDEPALGSLRLGQPATVTTDAGEERVGRVTYIASQAEFTPKNVQTRDERVKLVYRVKVALDNPDGLFKPGMPAEARFDGTGGEAGTSTGAGAP